VHNTQISEQSLIATKTNADKVQTLGKKVQRHTPLYLVKMKEDRKRPNDVGELQLQLQLLGMWAAWHSGSRRISTRHSRPWGGEHWENRNAPPVISRLHES